MFDPGAVRIVLLDAPDGPPEMEDATVQKSWAYISEMDGPEVTWAELDEAIESATLPPNTSGDRIVHVEIDQYDWGASGPVEVLYEVAMSWGFDAAITAISAWVLAKLGAVSESMEDMDWAARIAIKHLKKHHGLTEPSVESIARNEDSIDMVIRDGHLRYRVKVRGAHALILTAELVSGNGH